MSAIDPTLRTRLDRLRAYAERGIGGERVAAEKTLLALLKRAGFTRAQYEALDDEQTELRSHSYKGEHEKTLLKQIVMMVLNSREAAMYRPRGSGQRTVLLFELTARQHADITTLFAIYRHAWAAVLEDALVAFVARHGLHAAMRDVESEREPEPLDVARAMRLRAMMDGMDDVPRQRRISASHSHSAVGTE